MKLSYGATVTQQWQQRGRDSVTFVADTYLPATGTVACVPIETE